MRNVELPIWSLSQLAGLVTWLAVGTPLLLARLQGPVAGTFGLWLACYLTFGALFILITEPRLDRWLPHRSLLPLTLMTLLAFGVIGFGADYWVGGVLLIITASYVPHLLPSSGAALWVLGQTVVMAALFVMTGEVMSALVQTALYLGFQLFALFTTHTALSEAAAKERLARLNDELRVAQALLSESSRLSERLRIARELHDLIGHHLTALSLNLEVASHLTDGKAKAHIETSQGLAKGLLGDVREVVSSLRGDGLELSGALAVLIQDIPTPKVHFELAETFKIDDPQRAQVLLRCVQEIITNAVRHAHAENLWLSVAPSSEGITLRAHDDGQGTPEFTWGNGLIGMHERLEALGGRLELEPNPGRGFALTATFPA